MKKTGAIWSALVGMLAGSVISANFVGNYEIKKRNKAEDNYSKFKEFYEVLIQWLTIKQNGKSLAEYLEKNEYHSVAIYGMKAVGERLYDELKDTKTEVKYAIDQNAESIYADIDVYLPDDNLPEVDVIVVTATYYYNSILNNIKDKVHCPIVSLDDVIAGAEEI